MNNFFWHVLPILAAGTFALAIMIERSKALFKTYKMGNIEGFFENITSFVVSDRLAEAVAYCEKYSSKPHAQVARQALLRAHQPDQLIESGLTMEVGKVTQSILKRTSFLATIANVATLLGLFGTIAGLIHSFQAVGAADAQQKSALLAEGISQAMNATMLGLGVAIPCMVAFSFLINRTNHLVAEVDGAAVRTMDILRQRSLAVENELGVPR